MLHIFCSSQARSRYLSIFFIILFLLDDPQDQQNPQGNKFFSGQLTLDLVFSCREFGDSFLFQIPRKFIPSHFLEQILFVSMTKY